MCAIEVRQAHGSVVQLRKKRKQATVVDERVRGAQLIPQNGGQLQLLVLVMPQTA